MVYFLSVFLIQIYIDTSWVGFTHCLMIELVLKIKYSPVAQWYLPAGRRGAGNTIMFVYIIKSIHYNWYYSGLSDNVDRRYLEHNNGWVKKTKFYKPFQLIHVELTHNRIEARRLEKYFKSGYGKEIIKEIDQELNNPL